MPAIIFVILHCNQEFLDSSNPLLMRKKVFIFAVLLLMTGVSVTDARKRKEQKKDNVVLTSERHEIDNFDFLYNDTEYDAPKVSFT